MVDPRITRSNTLAGVHFRSGSPDPSEGFPDGTSFNSPLLLANVSNKPVKTHVSVNYTTQENLQMTPVDPKKDTEEKAHSVPLGDITIAPGDVQSIELSTTLAGVTAVEDSGVDVTYDADPGAIIGHLTSVDQSGDYSFEVPIKDPAGMNELTDGVYPWSIENGANAVLHLKNTTADDQNAMVTLLFPDGANYRLDLISLKPYQSITVDVQKLKASQKKDVIKQVFPTTAVSGQVQWRPETPNTVIGRMEQTDAKDGIARSFSCSSLCCMNYGASSFLSPGSLSGAVGNNGLVTGEYSGTDCNYVPFGPYVLAPGSWTVDSSTIASLSGTGYYYQEQVNYLKQGTTNVWGRNFNLLGYYLDNYTNRCRSYHYYEDASASVTVNPSTCNITLNFNGSKTPGDNLMFTSDFRECSEGLGPIECDAKQWWHLNMEGVVTVSDNASRWVITQQLISSRKHGHATDSLGNHVAFDQEVLPAGPDGPSAAFIQNPAGQKKLFWLDGPGHFFQNGTGPITDMIFTMNLTDTVESVDYPNVICTVNWHARLEVDFGPALNMTSSFGGYGLINLD